MLIACFSSNPTSTLMPFSSSIFTPFPFIFLFGSRLAQNTFLIPYLIREDVHGGVFENIEQGSRVIYAVDPKRSLVALALPYFFIQYLKAFTSA